MTDTSIQHHYPDLVALGSLERLVNAELESIHSPLRVVGFDRAFHGSPYWASARLDERHGELTTAADTRAFQASLWRSGVAIVKVSTPSLVDLVGSIHTWFVVRADSSSMCAQFPSASPTDQAASYEAGPQAYVAFCWARLLERLSRHDPELLAVALKAHASPALSRLLPYTSHTQLCFSRFTGYPFSNDVPVIAPVTRAQFTVTHPVTGSSLGQGGADDAVRIVVSSLPPGCGEAVHGINEGTA